ncbi:MAG: peptidyl-prolyl cis-trans isomerase [Labilithrix sp.]|nr:peptidyl-prolyl cis-trans isomerase [Labilithrix sp.]MBX3218029.1 peptidyl-prolyl cis-trans isomerase [Labilithrix sp.]
MTRSATVLLIELALFAMLACDDKKPATDDAPSAPASSLTAPTPSAPAAEAAPKTAAAEAAPKVPDAIAAQHVLVAYKGAKGAAKSVTRAKADAKKRAEEVVAKATGGADFSALVAEYSDDPGSKERMGSVGKFTRDKMTKPFSDAAFALAVDEVSGVVESDFGFHVIKRNQ